MAGPSVEAAASVHRGTTAPPMFSGTENTSTQWLSTRNVNHFLLKTSAYSRTYQRAHLLGPYGTPPPHLPPPPLQALIRRSLLAVPTSHAGRPVLSLCHWLLLFFFFLHSLQTATPSPTSRWIKHQGGGGGLVYAPPPPAPPPLPAPQACAPVQPTPPSGLQLRQGGGRASRFPPFTCLHSKGSAANKSSALATDMARLRRCRRRAASELRIFDSMTRRDAMRL